MKAPFPYFGGKKDVVDLVWQRLGSPKQYIEPFCGSAAVLLGAPSPASLEVVNDLNGFMANFWRAVKHQPQNVAYHADYPVSHIDLGSRHRWLMEQRTQLGDELQNCDWPGDAKAAGWWLWGQCSWIGSGWCEWSKIPHTSDAGRGVQAVGQIPHTSDAGRGVQAVGQIPHTSSAGMGVQAVGQIPHTSSAGMGNLLTSGGKAAWVRMHELAIRLCRVRIIHGDWHRCLNHHYGGDDTAVFLDPPYKAYESLYGTGKASVADDVAAWARDNAGLRIALCGHIGDYDLSGWDCVPWKRSGMTYAGAKTTDREAIWFSPACYRPVAQHDLFAEAVA